jgi:hypothetical protein
MMIRSNRRRKDDEVTASSSTTVVATVAATSQIFEEELEELVKLATVGLEQNYSTRLLKLDIKANVQAIVDFISCLKTKINLSDNHRRNIIALLIRLSKFFG